jgi:hypothetical protein
MKSAPPTWVTFGDADAMLAQGQEYAQKAKELGVPVTLLTAPKQPHGFFNRTPWIESTTAAADAWLVERGFLTGKGTLAPGSDADIVLWDPTKQVRLTNTMMQHAVDNTPYEGMEVTGWPVATLRRGEVVMQDGVVLAQPGSGQYLARGAYDLVRPRGVTAEGFGA